VAELVQHARMYALKGLEIFPVGSDKRPLSSQHNATTDLDQIEQWWERWPDALIGHRINPHVVLLDIDPRHNGKQTWDAIRAELNSHLPTTRVHISGREDGGGHVWFERPDGKLTTTKLDAWAEARDLGTTHGGRHTAGIDLLRHEHRYTILPPSPHPDTGKPYRWSPGRGLNVLPQRMPTWLAEMLTRDEAPTPFQPQPETFKQADSIADWFSENHTWADVLHPHGWTNISGDGDQDGSEWVHPEATSSVSATVRHGCLFVYSTNTPFEVTEPDDPKGYTRFAAYALLSFAGDQSKAASEARTRQRATRAPGVVVGRNENGSSPGDTHPPAGDQHGAIQRVELEHLEAFWTQRPILGQIRDFARARMCSPWAVLGVVLTRVAAATPPFVVLPPIVGSHASLNLYVCLTGKSGEGKDAAMSAGRDVLDVSRGIDFTVVGLGSGEGILPQYVEHRPANKATGEDAVQNHQHTQSVLFKNAEIGTIGAVKSRSAATLMPVLRDAWMGSELGFAYVSNERRFKLAEHRYRLCVILGCQPTSADVLLEEADVGTPQRFVWLPVEDPGIPDELPPEPEIPDWRLPEWPAAVDGRVIIELCDEAIEAVVNARRARQKGERLDDTPSGHDLLCREKVAAVLAILDGRAAVALDDWSLAGVISTVSTRTRERMAAIISDRSRRSNRARAMSEAERQVIVSSTVEEDAIQRVCSRLVAKVGSEWVTGSVLRKVLASRDRGRFDEAMDRLTSAGQVESEVVEHRGQMGVRYRRKSG
jgi:hypothetical protein